MPTPVPAPSFAEVAALGKTVIGLTAPLSATLKAEVVDSVNTFVTVFPKASSQLKPTSYDEVMTYLQMFDPALNALAVLRSLIKSNQIRAGALLTDVQKFTTEAQAMLLTAVRQV